MSPSITRRRAWPSSASGFTGSLSSLTPRASRSARVCCTMRCISISTSEFGIDRRELLHLDFLHADLEVRALSGNFVARVDGGENHKKSLPLTRADAGKTGLELGQHAALAEHHGHPDTRAPGKFVPVYAAGEIHGDAVTCFRSTRHGFPARALLSQDLNGAVDVRIVHRVGGSLNRRCRQIAELYLRVDLESGAEGELFPVAPLLAFDARITGDLQLLLLDHFGKRFLHSVADHFRPYLRPIVLRDDLERNLARAKAVHAHGARELAQPLLDFAVDLLGRNRHVEPPFQPA